MRGEILSGKATRERKLAVCSGGASLAPEDRVELLAVLVSDADGMIAPRAAGALLSQSLEAFRTALARLDAAPALFRYCAANLADKPGVADTMANNPTCPPEFLPRVARYFSPATVQGLVDDLDRLSSAPALAAVLASSPSLSAEQRGLLQELQRESGDEAGIAEAVAAAEPDSAKRQTLLQRLARMHVVERMQLALKGNREERLALIRDPCKVVQRAVLQSPRVSDDEIEGYAAMANLSEEVLRLIAKNRSFIKKYVVARNLLNNPKTPLDVSLHLLPRLEPRDLQLLTVNKNVPETLRTMATKLHRQRSLARKGD